MRSGLINQKCLQWFNIRITLNIEDEVLEKASKLTSIKEKTSLVKLDLEALIARESGKRLAKLGGTEKEMTYTCLK